MINNICKLQKEEDDIPFSQVVSINLTRPYAKTLRQHGAYESTTFARRRRKFTSYLALPSCRSWNLRLSVNTWASGKFPAFFKLEI